MKKLINRLSKRKSLPPSSRITTETVAEHREHILSGGRRFKYPIQYVRHKLVINAILITVSAVIITVAIGWWQLYPMQNASEFMYRVTKVIPVPVATVDGYPVLYSDYLMKYLSSIHVLETKEQLNQKTDNGKAQVNYIKQQSIKDAISDAYAINMAKKLNLSVSESEFKSFLKDKRNTVNGEISEQSYYAIVLDWYGWSPSDYRHITENAILRQKVSYAMDKDALDAATKVDAEVKKDIKVDFNNLAASIAKQTGLDVSYGNSGWVPKLNQDGGLSVEAAKLKKNEVSSIIKSSLGKGYYVLRLLEIEESRLKYEYIQVPLTAFAKSLATLEKKNKVIRYISITEQSEPTKSK